MANSPQARKRARQNTRRRLRNMSQRSALRTSIKKFLKLAGVVNPAGGKSGKGGKDGSPANRRVDREAAAAAYRAATSGIDRAVSKNLHHKNRAARLKKRLNNRLRALNA